MNQRKYNLQHKFCRCKRSVKCVRREASFSLYILIWWITIHFKFKHHSLSITYIMFSPFVMETQTNLPTPIFQPPFHHTLQCYFSVYLYTYIFPPAEYLLGDGKRKTYLDPKHYVTQLFFSASQRLCFVVMCTTWAVPRNGRGGMGVKKKTKKERWKIRTRCSLSSTKRSNEKQITDTENKEKKSQLKF